MSEHVMNWAAMIEAISQRISAHRDELNALDAATGDGDHGTGVSVAFQDAADKSAALDDPALADVLQVAASSLMNRMGGSSGALYGTFFLRLSLGAKGLALPEAADWARMLEEGAAGVMQRGKAQPGDKTLLDALLPAVEAFGAAAASGKRCALAWSEAAQAARSGAEQTTTMVARHGRAKFLGERSVGHIDAGAASMALLFEAVSEFWKGHEHDET